MSRHTAVFSSTGTSSSLRQSSIHPLSSQQSSPLAARIAAKRLELENLRQLRDVSGALASQMEALEEKLTTLKNGTEAVACVMANWGNVLSAISMASTKVAAASERDHDAEGKETEKDEEKTPPLPSTLVRIPAE
ncbi:DASH complex subunit DAD2 [Blastomyces parvus]|uniref:DASH complex subunit DAD2 n=1 Tax=Blastomyces parvus TaxID=2060905 RepID=A0A2B7WWR6_9EURO|nr:DASH complex subunit DAD2 [Blastomyces parvus]